MVECGYPRLAEGDINAGTISEQSGSSGMGWGTIGGRSSSSIAGLEDQLGRITMYIAVAFLIVSAVVGALTIRS